MARGKLYVAVGSLIGLVLGLVAGAWFPTTVRHPHGCPKGAPRSACFSAPVTEHHYWMYGLLGLAFSALAVSIAVLRVQDGSREDV